MHGQQSIKIEGVVSDCREFTWNFVILFKSFIIINRKANSSRKWLTFMFTFPYSLPRDIGTFLSVLYVIFR